MHVLVIQMGLLGWVGAETDNVRGSRVGWRGHSLSGSTLNASPSRVVGRVNSTVTMTFYNRIGLHEMMRTG
jgi:hypothetical protein